MKNFSGKIVEKINTQYIFSQNRAFFLDNVEKYNTDRQATRDNMVRRGKRAIFMPYNQGNDTHPHS
jgi:hypothetical protein